MSTNAALSTTDVLPSDSASRDALRRAGFDLLTQPTNYSPSFGRNQLITIDAHGNFRGASDPRRDGGVAAYSTRA